MFDWVKLLHLLGAIVYAGGILAVSRLAAVAIELPTVEGRASLLKTLRRAHKYGDWTALALLLFSGLWALFESGADYLSRGYMHWKLGLAALFLICDFMMAKRLFTLNAESPQYSPKFFKAIHGVLSLLLILILATVTVFPKG